MSAAAATSPVELAVKLCESNTDQKNPPRSPPVAPPSKGSDVLAESSLSQMREQHQGDSAVAGGATGQAPVGPRGAAAAVADSNNGSRALPTAKGGVQQDTANKKARAKATAAKERDHTLVKRGQCRLCRAMGHHQNVCPEMECKSCHKKGHMARDCPCWECGGVGHRKAQCPIVVARMAAVQCFRCEEFGHLQKRCKNPKVPRARKAVGEKLPEGVAKEGDFAVLRDAVANGDLGFLGKKEIGEMLANYDSFDDSINEAKKALSAIDKEVAAQKDLAAKETARLAEAMKAAHHAAAAFEVEAKARKAKVVAELKARKLTALQNRARLTTAVGALNGYRKAGAPVVPKEDPRTYLKVVKGEERGNVEEASDNDEASGIIAIAPVVAKVAPASTRQFSTATPKRDGKRRIRSTENSDEEAGEERKKSKPEMMPPTPPVTAAPTMLGSALAVVKKAVTATVAVTKVASKREHAPAAKKTTPEGQRTGRFGIFGASFKRSVAGNSKSPAAGTK